MQQAAGVHYTTMEQALAEMLEDLRRGPVVYRDGDAFIFTDRDHPGFIYEITDAQCEDAGSALRWIAHMAVKSWVTPKHLEQFALLAAEQFGGFYP